MDALGVARAFVAICAAFLVLSGPVHSHASRRERRCWGRVLDYAAGLALAALVFFAQSLGLKLVPIAANVRKPKGTMLELHIDER